MTNKEKIAAALKRVQELLILIEHWRKDDELQRYGRTLRTPF